MHNPMLSIEGIVRFNWELFHRHLTRCICLLRTSSMIRCAGRQQHPGRDVLKRAAKLAATIRNAGGQHGRQERTHNKVHGIPLGQHVCSIGTPCFHRFGRGIYCSIFIEAGQLISRSSIRVLTKPLATLERSTSLVCCSYSIDATILQPIIWLLSFAQREDTRALVRGGRQTSLRPGLGCHKYTRCTSTIRFLCVLNKQGDDTEIDGACLIATLAQELLRCCRFCALPCTGHSTKAPSKGFYTSNHLQKSSSQHKVQSCKSMTCPRYYPNACK